MSAEFWNDRFAHDTFVYGTAPNTFIAEATDAWLPPGCSVLDVGAGEGRNAVALARRGHAVTALDYSDEGLVKAETLAMRHGLTLDTIQADVTTWTPERTWDALVCTFLHLPAPDRPRFYETLQAALAPGGWLVAEWFRPEQITEGYDSGGPPDVTMMVTPQELRDAFDPAGLQVLRDATPTLDEGPHHQGPAATVQCVWHKPDAA